MRKISIGTYEDSMLPQVIALFCDHYGLDPGETERAFVAFYGHPFQRDQAIRFVALDGDRVVGFQSFFYWPYYLGGKRLVAYQSGRSLIAPDYRGRGVFGRLLAYLDEVRSRFDIDCLIGFPAAVSRGSLIRNGWTNLLNLSWYAKPIHPFSILLPKDLAGVETSLDRLPMPLDADHPPEAFSLVKDAEFEAWRAAWQPAGVYHYFHYRRNDSRVRFDLRFQRRGPIKALVIGDLLSDVADAALVEEALGALIRTVRAHRFITILAIALNRGFANDALVVSLRRSGFFRLRPQIYFCVKNLGDDPRILDPTRWRLFRADMDTW